MKKYRIYIIIVILCTALGGLIYVQAEYIKRGLILKEQIFNQIVNEALMRSAFHVEQREAESFFNSYTKFNQFYNRIIDGDPYKESFSLNYEDGIYKAQLLQNDTLYNFEASTLENLDSLMNKANICVDLIPINKNPSVDMISEYNDLFRDMAMEYIYGGDDDKVMIDSSELAEILNFELNRAGVTTPFDFALLDGYSFRKIISSYSTVSRVVYESAYKAPIRINTGSSGHAILMIDFPNKRAFIFQANKTLLSFSFIFILLIASSFAASIFIIFRQKRLSELKTDFINNMTHELKTPVATISLATEMLSKEKVQADKSKVSNYASIIDEENKRLGNHIEKVLQIAQMGREVMKLKKEKIDVHQILDDVIRKYELRFEDNQVDLKINKNAQKTIIFGDKIHIYNVLSNLIDNALKYRSDRSLKISVKTENLENFVFISVNDNGVGISKNNLNKIFTQFYRVPSGNIHNVKGFGLGLSYVKSIVEKHNGTVEAESELNKYATFTIKLPLLEK